MGIVFGMMVAYFAVIAILVLRTPKTTKSTSFEEFYTGSKTLGGFMIGIVMLVTCMSGSTWTGWVGMGFENGVFIAYCIPYVCIAWAVFLYILADKIWPLGKHYGLSTMADLYELRYQNKGIKIFTGLVGAVMNVTWITMEIVTLGYIINVASNFHISTAVGSLIGVIFMVAYTLWGGVRSIAKVNYFQSIVMLIGCLVCVLFVIFNNFDSIPAMFNTVHEYLPAALTLPGPEGIGTDKEWFSWTFLCCIGLLCYPSLYLKIYMGKSVNAIRKSAITAGASSIWMEIVLVLASFAVIAYQAKTGIDVTNVESSLLLVVQNSGSMLMLGIACVFILAATMGTIDGTLLAISGIFSNDVVEGFRRINKNDGNLGTAEYHGALKVGGQDGDKTLRETRIIIVIIAVAAYLITLFDLPLLVWVAMINYQVIGQLCVPLFGAVFWKKATVWGTATSIVAALLTTVIPLAIGIEPFGFLPGVTGLVVGAIVYIIVCLATYKPDRPEALIFPQIKKVQSMYLEKQD